MKLGPKGQQGASYGKTWEKNPPGRRNHSGKSPKMGMNMSCLGQCGHRRVSAGESREMGRGLVMLDPSGLDESFLRRLLPFCQ